MKRACHFSLFVSWILLISFSIIESQGVVQEKTLKLNTKKAANAKFVDTNPIKHRRSKLSSESRGPKVARDGIVTNDDFKPLYDFGNGTKDQLFESCDDCQFPFRFKKQSVPLFSSLGNRVKIFSNGYAEFENEKNTAPRLNILNTDLSTTVKGYVYGRGSFNASSKDALQANEDIRKLNKALSFKTQVTLVASFIRVGQYLRSDIENTFQLVLASDLNKTFAILNYHKIGSINANVGYSEGKCGSKIIAEKGTAKDLVNSSNIGVKGRHVFQLTNTTCHAPPFQVKEFVIRHSLEEHVLITMHTESNIFKSSEDKTDIKTVVSEMESTNENPRDLFIKGFKDGLQTYYSFYASPRNGDSTVYFNNIVVLHGAPKNTSFQYGTINVTSQGISIQCKYEKFTSRMRQIPSVKLTVDIGPDHKYDILRQTHTWLRKVTHDGFQVCYKTAVMFSGHRNVSINYVAVVANASEDTLKFSRKKLFKENGVFVVPENRTSNCFNVSLKYVYTDKVRAYITPVEKISSQFVPFVWLKTTTNHSIEVCTLGRKEYPHTLFVNYIISGNLNVCSFKKCPKHLQCHVNKHGRPYCGCIDSCQSKEVFCGTDFTSYTSHCELYKKHCLKHGNESMTRVKKAYSGHCQKFPHQVGTTQLEHVPGIPVAFCKDIKINANDFDPNEKVFVQLTVAWKSKIYTNTTKDATAVWSEDVTHSGFRACALVAGRHFFGMKDIPSVNWLVYQETFIKNNDEVESFSFDMPTWYTGGRCLPFNLNKVKLWRFAKSWCYIKDVGVKAQLIGKGSVSYLVSVEHTTRRTFENALTVWVETNVDRICVREFQNFDGKHSGIKVHLLAVSGGNNEPKISQTGTVTFPAKLYDVNHVITAKCKNVRFSKQIRQAQQPVVLVSSSTQNPKRQQDSIFSNTGITSWIEGISHDTNGSQKLCQKSIQTDNFVEEIKTGFVVFPRNCSEGWEDFGGKCYHLSKSACMNFYDATKYCEKQKGTLPLVENDFQYFWLEKETNKKAWIGLTDEMKENDWVWVKSLSSKYTKWLSGKPDGKTEENCAVLEKTSNETGFNDVNCKATCAEVICQK